LKIGQPKNIQHTPSKVKGGLKPQIHRPGAEADFVIYELCLSGFSVFFVQI
jgi:hypothetical protein